VERGYTLAVKLRRREFIVTLVLGLLVSRRRASAQASAKVPRVGYLGGSQRAASPTLKTFLEGLEEMGYVPGQNILLEVRAPERPDKYEQFPGLAAQLVAAGVDVILASTPSAIEATTKATKTIPIVGVDLESDPVAKGWAASLTHPGGNFTGFVLDIPEMSGKQLQFLKEVKPDLRRVAVLGDPRVNELQSRTTEAAARGAGLTIQALSVRDVGEVPAAIAEAARERAGGLVVLTSPLVFNNLGRIVDAAVKHRLPAICPFSPTFADAGGLIAYGPDLPDFYRRAAGYVSRILKGAKPGDLPVQRPEKFQLVVNRKTARALKLTLPQSLVLRADRVIE
jgi:putative tryptophan/tyrosine transport system substrate-binding protein